MRPCPVCGGRPRFLFRTPHNPPLEILRCPDCTLQMQARLPENPDAWYNEGYYSGDASYAYRDERRTLGFDRHVWRARLRTLARFVPPPADFLDAGAAFGGFVEEAGRFGYRALGMDVSAHAVREARTRGVPVEPGGLCDPDLLGRGGPLAAESFDVLTMVEVLEHLADPVVAMGNARALLRPGGMLLVQTADLSGLQARIAGRNYHYYLPGHLHCWTRASLRRLLLDAGFSRIRLIRGTDFGLLPKLRKSRGGFRGFWDHRRWARIALYHWASRVGLGDLSLTSSMTVRAFR